jgi:hypothetical protein
MGQDLPRNSKMKKLYAPMMLSALLLAFATPASAILLSFVPENQTRLLGKTAIIDVVVSGLTDSDPDEIVSAFDLSLLYDPAIVQVNSVTLDAVSLMGGDSGTLSDVQSNPGQIDFSVSSLLTDEMTSPCCKRTRIIRLCWLASSSTRSVSEPAACPSTSRRRPTSSLAVMPRNYRSVPKMEALR